MLGHRFDLQFVIPANSRLADVVKLKGIPCHRLPMAEISRSFPGLVGYIPTLAFNTLRLRRLLARRKIDVVIINDYYNLLGAASKATGWGGRVITIVRLLPRNQYTPLNWVWSQLAVRCSHAVVAVSRAVKSQLPSRENILVVYDPASSVEKHSDARRVRTVHDEIVCLYLANYISGKGHVAALDAFALAYRECPKLRLRFVGSDMGLTKNRDLKMRLEKKAVSLDLRHAVQFLDFVTDVESEIKNSDIILNFSVSESFSQTCLEGSQFGRPVIATRCGGPEEIIDDGVSGILVPTHDTQAMAKAIIELAVLPELRNRMGEAGRQIVRSRFKTRIALRRYAMLIDPTMKWLISS